MKKVLLTNSTGFVGGATVARLLSATDAEVVAVVRARSRTDGEARVHASVARFGSSAPVLLRRLNVLRDGPGAPHDRVDLSDVTQVIDAPEDGWAWICGNACPRAVAVGDRLASSILGLLARPRLAHARYRLWAGAGGGSFDALLHACVATSRATLHLARSTSTDR